MVKRKKPPVTSPKSKKAQIKESFPSTSRASSVISSCSLSPSPFTTTVQASKERLGMTPTKDSQMHSQTGTTDVAPPGVLSSNPFACLAPHEKDEDRAPVEKIPKPPPIYVSNLTNYMQLCADLIQICGANNFVCKCRINNVIISAKTIEDYRKIIHYLSEKNAEYHTYQLKQDKAFRVVIRSLHHTTPPEVIKQELSDLGFLPRNVTNVLHRNTKKPLPLFFVDLEPQNNNKDVFKLKVLNYTRIRVEEPYKQFEIVQCKRCQQYGHTKAYCRHPPYCAKCAEPHLSKECPKPITVPRKCVLCGNNHSASYKGCSVHKELQRMRRPKPVYEHPSAVRRDYPGPPSLNAFPALKEVNRTTTTNAQISYAQMLRSEPALQPQLPLPQPNPTSDITSVITSFLSDLKSTINPLINLLTTLITNLLPRLAP